MDTPVRQIGNVRVVAPQGRVDQATAEALRLSLEPHLAACTANAAPLILDFSGVPYISSVGLRVLMLAGRQVTAQQGRLAIAALRNGAVAKAPGAPARSMSRRTEEARTRRC